MRRRSQNKAARRCTTSSGAALIARGLAPVTVTGAFNAFRRLLDLAVDAGGAARHRRSLTTSRPPVVGSSRGRPARKSERPRGARVAPPPRRRARRAQALHRVQRVLATHADPGRRPDRGGRHRGSGAVGGVAGVIHPRSRHPVLRPRGHTVDAVASVDIDVLDLQCSAGRSSWGRPAACGVRPRSGGPRGSAELR